MQDNVRHIKIVRKNAIEWGYNNVKCKGIEVNAFNMHTWKNRMHNDFRCNPSMMC